MPHRRGEGVDVGHVMKALGDRAAAKITVRDVEACSHRSRRPGVSARTVNKHRAIVSAIFNYGMRESTFGLPANPAAEPTSAGNRTAARSPTTASRRSRHSPGRSRTASTGPPRRAQRAGAEAQTAEDPQDAEIVRVSAYAGLRLGELLALRWRDVDFAGHAITVAARSALA